MDRSAVNGLGRCSEVPIAVVRDEEIQEGQSEIEQLRQEIAFDLIDPPRGYGGRVDRFNQLIELDLSLEESLLLIHDHGGSLGRGEHSGVVTDVLPQGSHFFHPLSS
ncbi:hypothetical protein V5E97_25450 [Singulisphaera sp. Ch08]|uniref:Uncharacterized protein n=1 Tax=Singulisphaera sp. Ch08 TaxID=3120278 RepID=A0AAU7C9Q6_9BACT